MLQDDAHLTIPSPYYRVSIKALIFDHEDRILVVQTDDGFWELPGGGWEHGETMQQCVQRELKEELGISATVTDFITMYPYVAKGRTGHMRLKIALKVALDTADFLFGKDFKATKFVTAKELADLPMIGSEAGIKDLISRIWHD